MRLIPTFAADMRFLKSSHNNMLGAVLLALLATLLWAGNFILSRKVNATVPPIHLAFFRWLFASIIIGVIGYSALQKEWGLIKKHILYLLLVSAVGVSMYNTLLYYAAHFTEAMNLTLIGATSPFFTFIFARIILKEKLPLHKLLGFAISFTSILFLLSKGQLTLLASLKPNKGDLWMLLATNFWATYTVLVRKKPATISPLSFQASTFIIGCMLLLPAMLLEKLYYPSFSILQNRSLFYFSTIYMAVGPSLICFYAWNKSIRTIGPSSTALFLNFIPVFTAMLAPMFLPAEPIQWYHYLALGGVVVGVACANFLFKAKEA